MKVLKFGGSSVASHKEIVQVGNIIKEAAEEISVVVVVSAMKGVTDKLEMCAGRAADGSEEYTEILAELENCHLVTVRELIPVKRQSAVITKVKMWLNQLEDVCRGVYLIREISPKTMDFIYSFGELMSAYILSESLMHRELNARFIDSRSLLKTNRSFGKALADLETTSRLINEALKDVEFIPVLPGFIASTYTGETTTLGRGGSDYTASLVAAALRAERLEIWTDVEGVFTADPRIVPAARPVQKLSYEEAMELAHFGANIIYPPTMQPVMERNISILIKNTFKPKEDGTLITGRVTNGESRARGLSGMDNIALLTLSGSSMVGVPGVAARLFKALAEYDINIIIITQASSEHTITVGFGEKDVELALTAVENEFEHEITLHRINQPEIERNLSIVSLVGDDMKMQPGIAGNFFSTLGKAGININAIAQGSSERNISVVVQSSDKTQAIQVLHANFFS